MKASTRLWIGAALLAAGLAVASLGFFSGGSDVRQVAQVLADPTAHMHGTYTLLGVPQPPTVPVAGAAGTRLAPNPEAVNATVHVTPWTRAGVAYFSTHTLTVEAGAGATRFLYANETRVAGQPGLAFPVTSAQWTLRGAAFGVRGFQAGPVTPPAVWGVYAGPFKDPLQPKPSQFVGHLLAALPDGAPLPDGALVYQIDSYTAGCSSKFLPPEEQARLAATGDP